MNDANEPDLIAPLDVISTILAGRRWLQMALLAWGMVMFLSWGGYFPFTSGTGMGVHRLVFAYSHLVWVTVFFILAVLFTLPIFGAAFWVLLLVSLKGEWRRSAQRAAKILLGVLLAEGLGTLALLPPGLMGYVPQQQIAIAPWQQTYHTVYVSYPLDDNYGDVMLLKCNRLALCWQVYRTYTNVISVEEAFFDFDTEKDQLRLRLEGQSVYVTSRKAEICQMNPQKLSEFGKCE